MALLQVNNLRTYFGTPENPKKVVDDVSFTVEAGQTLGLVGESGCGKSLTALSVMQLLPAAARNAGGEVLFKGKDVLKLPPAARRYMRGRNISMIFQEPMTSLNPVLSVRTQLLEAVGKSIRHSRFLQAFPGCEWQKVHSPKGCRHSAPPRQSCPKLLSRPGA